MNDLINLKREIEASNILNSFTKKAIEKIMPQLISFINKKIFLADGSKAKNFVIDVSDLIVKKIEDASKSVIQYCYLDKRNCMLNLEISLCHNGGSYEIKKSNSWTKYTKQSFELGLCDGQILQSVKTIEEITKLYNLNEILDFENELSKIRQYKYLAEQAEKIRSTINVDAEFYKYI